MKTRRRAGSANIISSAWKFTAEREQGIDTGDDVRDQMEYLAGQIQRMGQTHHVDINEEQARGRPEDNGRKIQKNFLFRIYQGADLRGEKNSDIFVCVKNVWCGFSTSVSGEAQHIGK